MQIIVMQKGHTIRERATMYAVLRVISVHTTG
jgi:hypothetical protein